MRQGTGPKGSTPRPAGADSATPLSCSTCTVPDGKLASAKGLTHLVTDNAL